MASDAKIFVRGNLIKDAEIKKVSTQNGSTDVTNFCIAVRTSKKNEDGQYESDFYNVQMWSKPADWIAKALTKGTTVDVVGTLMLQKYTKDGQMRQSMNINALEVTPMFRKNGDSSKAKKEVSEVADSLPF